MKAELFKDSESGRTFCVNLKGDCVEFYDHDQDHSKFGALGQFTGGRYYIDTIMGYDRYGRGEGGLVLHGAVPSWDICSDTMDTIRNWIKNNTTITVKEESQ